LEEFFDKNCNEFIDWLNDQWSFNYRKQRPDIAIEGSPERTVSRTVIQNQSNDLFLIEKFSKYKFESRQTVAIAVDYLNKQGLDMALGYQKTIYGEFLPFWKDHFYGLSPFLSSSILVRPDYLHSFRMGESFSFFLGKMKAASNGIEENLPLQKFSIKIYIYKLFSQIKKFDPEWYQQFFPFLTFLENRFMRVHDHLPMGFCHGDLHPLNVIWDKDQIKAVIDWEFLGIKPQIYDAANLVGCAGIENPEGLVMEMIQTFLHTLRAQNFFYDAGWELFPEYVLALRFAWLSEWLRKKDHQMIAMETVFMKILMDNMDDLRQAWKI